MREVLQTSGITHCAYNCLCVTFRYLLQLVPIAEITSNIQTSTSNIPIFHAS